MACDFIALVGDHRYNDSVTFERSGNDALAPTAMDCRISSTSLQLFVGKDTPTVSISGSGLIAGRIFSKSGQPISEELGFSGSIDQLIAHLLENFWGEYVAIIVAETGAVHVLRDPSGGVPCVYSIAGGSGFLTSDISIACELGIYKRGVDWDVVSHFLAFPYLRMSRSGLTEVNELLPGCRLDCNGTCAEARAAWSPWRYLSSEERHKDRNEAAAGIRSAVSCVVNAWADIDGPVVMELSGGLDSSIVAACLSSHGRRVTFCTLVMPVAGTDERHYAQLLADQAGRALQSVDVGLSDASFDFPYPPRSVVPAIGILQHAVNEAWKAAGTKYDVAGFYSGAGGDSVFCYLKTASPAADAFLERGVAAGIKAMRDLSALHQCTVWKAARLTLRKLTKRSEITWKCDHSFLRSSHVTDATMSHPWLDAPADALPGDREKVMSLAGTQLFRDATPRGEGRFVRFPLLSQPALEACLKVPTWMWIEGGRNRAVARDAFSDVLPDGILHRRSKGSYMSYMAAVYLHNRDGMRDFLAEGHLRSRDLLDWPALEKYLAADLAPRDLSFVRILDLCMVENWLRSQLP